MWKGEANGNARPFEREAEATGGELRDLAAAGAADV